MEFRISDTFTDSLARLTGDEQKAVKTKAFDLQMNPANPGMQFHRIDRAKDKNFWSVRVSRDIRIIVHKTGISFMLCYVDHHDNAYQWAERRKIEVHPKTGAAQLVEVRETVREIEVPKYIEVEQPAPPKLPLFGAVDNEDLLKYGVPPEWLDDVKRATEDTLFELAAHLPQEASEALLELATGGVPQTPARVASTADPFTHPDAQRRFRIMADSDELRQALEYPWDKWSVFLHPAQRALVEREFNGPARVSGAAGTGKTIVALHRAVYLAKKHRDARVLLTTFSETLANALRGLLRRLISSDPRLAERLEVHSIGGIGLKVYENNFKRPVLATKAQVQDLLKQAAAKVAGNKFSAHFLWSEWSDVVDAWQLQSWDDYRDVTRLGRKKRLSESQRASLWKMFEEVRSALKKQGVMTESEMFGQLATKLKGFGKPLYDYCVIDEAQDIGVAELRFLAALGGGRANGLFFTGDLGQRIFQQPFSWKSLGVDIQGRSQTLKINYRTSHQIRRHADQLLPAALADVDGVAEGRKGTISVFDGTPPVIKILGNEAQEQEAVGQWVKGLRNGGYQSREIGVFVRSAEQLPRVHAALKSAGEKWIELDESVDPRHEHISVCTMHLAKGLEFRAVAVMACDDEVIPLQERIESVSDDSDLDEVYQTERHLLYVACTRARDNLFVTGVAPASEFLDDLLA